MRCRLLLHWRALWLSFSITLAIMQICNFPLASTVCPCKLNFLEGRHHLHSSYFNTPCTFQLSLLMLLYRPLVVSALLCTNTFHFQSETWLQNYSRVTACLRWQQKGGFRVWRLGPFCVECAGSPFAWMGSLRVIRLSPTVQTCLWSV